MIWSNRLLLPEVHRNHDANCEMDQLSLSGIIAPEHAEASCISHEAAVQGAADAPLPIREKARRMLRAIAEAFEHFHWRRVHASSQTAQSGSKKRHVPLGAPIPLGAPCPPRRPRKRVQSSGWAGALGDERGPSGLLRQRHATPGGAGSPARSPRCRRRASPPTPARVWWKTECRSRSIPIPSRTRTASR